MNLFEDLTQRVILLNSQLRRVEQDPGSETRKILQNHLWLIVEELNERLGLRLENIALDLYAEGTRLVIHYFENVSGVGENEIYIRIDPSFSLERHVKNLGDPGKQAVLGSGLGADSTIPGWKKSDLPVGIENQGNSWGDEAPQDPKSPDKTK